MVDILYEDNHLLVVDKPKNLLTQGDITGDKTLVDICKEYLKEKKGKTEGDVYLGLVHRLDRPTSGVVVLAKTSKCAKRLTEAFKNHEVEKNYLFITKAVNLPLSGRLENYLKKDEVNNIVKITPLSVEGAKKAVLNYDIIAKTDNYNLIKVDLKTGRSHQIRVQFANINAPIYGDAKYDKDYKKGEKLALHAYKLSFNHPTKGDKMTFISYPDMNEKPWNEFNLEKLVNEL